MLRMSDNIRVHLVHPVVTKANCHRPHLHTISHRRPDFLGRFHRHRNCLRDIRYIDRYPMCIRPHSVQFHMYLCCHNNHVRPLRRHFLPMHSRDSTMPHLLYPDLNSDTGHLSVTHTFFVRHLHIRCLRDIRYMYYRLVKIQIHSLSHNMSDNSKYIHHQLRYSYMFVHRIHFRYRTPYRRDNIQRMLHWLSFSLFHYLDTYDVAFRLRHCNIRCQLRHSLLRPVDNHTNTPHDNWSS